MKTSQTQGEHSGRTQKLRRWGRSMDTSGKMPKIARKTGRFTSGGTGILLWEPCFSIVLGICRFVIFTVYAGCSAGVSNGLINKEKQLKTQICLALSRLLILNARLAQKRFWGLRAEVVGKHEILVRSKGDYPLFPQNRLLQRARKLFYFPTRVEIF